MKVFILQEIIPNYRVPVFRRIARLENIKLGVFYSDPSRIYKAQNLKNAFDMSGFRAIKLPLIQIGRYAYQLSFFRYLVVERPDAVILGNALRLDRILFMLFNKLTGIRTLCFLGGVPYIDDKKIQQITRRGILNRLFPWFSFRRWLMNKADGLIVYSDHAKAYYAKRGFPDEKIWVAQNSPDTDALQALEKELRQERVTLQSTRSRFSPSGEHVILMLGRLNPARKMDVLLDAYKEIISMRREVSLVVVGDGDERKNLEKTVADLKLPNVYFEGAVYDDRSLAKYFMACDIFVTPGIASLAVKQAMVFGKPVVTADYGLEVHAVEHGKNGLVVPLGSSSELAKNILYLLSEDAVRKSMGIQARKLVEEKYNINVMIEGFRQALASV